MSTVTLKISSGGALLPAHPHAKCGPQNRVYAILNVPADISVQACAQQANRICFAHRYDDASAYSYAWSELAGKPQGAIINRYPRAA